MDTVRRIVYLKLRPLHFQIKTHYPSDVNYPTELTRLRLIIRLKCEYGQCLDLLGLATARFVFLHV